MTMTTTTTTATTTADLHAAIAILISKGDALYKQVTAQGLPVDDFLLYAGEYAAFNGELWADHEDWTDDELYDLVSALSPFDLADADAATLARAKIIIHAALDIYADDIDDLVNLDDDDPECLVYLAALATPTAPTKRPDPRDAMTPAVRALYDEAYARLSLLSVAELLDLI